MHLNTTSQYAIRVLIHINKFGNEKLYTAKELAEHLNIPYKYLTKIMTNLVDASILESIRGNSGGYRLLKKASDIYLIDILEAVKETLDDRHCVLSGDMCQEDKKCALHDRWSEPKLLINALFKETTLADL